MLFDNWGIWVVGVGRMVAGIRGAMVLAAGTIRYKQIGPITGELLQGKILPLVRELQK